MKIAVACDHGGLDFKRKLISYLEDLKHIVDDYGCNSQDSCDYPDYAIPAVKSVVEGKNERAILVCTNGIGMCILANKFPGILAALVYSEKTAEMTRKHHGSNVLCLGAGMFKSEELLQFTRIWLNTEFEGGRHQRRVSKILELDGIKNG
jgi:ribose 5-phosphate isomerase B